MSLAQSTGLSSEIYPKTRQNGWTTAEQRQHDAYFTYFLVTRRISHVHFRWCGCCANDNNRSECEKCTPTVGLCEKIELRQQWGLNLASVGLKSSALSIPPRLVMWEGDSLGGSGYDECESGVLMLADAPSGGEAEEEADWFLQLVLPLVEGEWVREGCDRASMSTYSQVLVRDGPVAQWVEHWTSDLELGGSNPTGGGQSFLFHCCVVGLNTVLSNEWLYIICRWAALRTK